jgi:hypothetical protein
MQGGQSLSIPRVSGQGPRAFAFLPQHVFGAGTAGETKLLTLPEFPFRAQTPKRLLTIKHSPSYCFGSRHARMARIFGTESN